MAPAPALRICGLGKTLLAKCSTVSRRPQTPNTAGGNVLPHASQGSQCPDAYVEAAKKVAGGLARYEGAAALSGVTAQGAESRAVRDALSLPDGFQAQENRAYDADFRVRRAQSCVGLSWSTATHCVQTIAG